MLIIDVSQPGGFLSYTIVVAELMTVSTEHAILWKVIFFQYIQISDTSLYLSMSLVCWESYHHSFFYTQIPVLVRDISSLLYYNLDCLIVKQYNAVIM